LWNSCLERTVNCHYSIATLRSLNACLYAVSPTGKMSEVLLLHDTHVSTNDIIKKSAQTLLLHPPYSADLTGTFSPDYSFERWVVRTPLQDEEALKNAMSQQLEKMKNVFHWLGTHALVWEWKKTFGKDGEYST
jgi:hypothetical protein